MDNALKSNPLQPRTLRYRSHYRIYLIFLLSVAVLLAALWGFRAYLFTWEGAANQFPLELMVSLGYFMFLPVGYHFWLKPRINHAVQVHSTHLILHKGKTRVEMPFDDIESVTIVGWSLFYFKMKNGHKHYFNSDLERVDYIWEGLHRARPDLMEDKSFEDFRLNLVKCDHHQKRREWFFRHKLVDMMNWIFLPVAFLVTAWLIQSQDIMIHHEALYFFRLFMYSLLILLMTSFAYSFILKKLVFDRKLETQEGEKLDKVRDLEFEGVVIQRSKIFQLMTSTLLLTVVIKGDFNFYSISKAKGDLALFKIPTGKTIIVDNRYNCMNCRYKLTDGDLVMFGKGVIGQVLAKEGDPVGEVMQDKQGRTIASLNVQEVPKGHVAVKAANGKEIIFIKVVDLIGKIKK